MAKHNYIDKWTCIAMMNKNCTLLGGSCLGFNKTKNGSKVAVFSLDYAFDQSKHKQVSWLYLDEKPEGQLAKSAYCLEEIVSRIDGKKMFWEGVERPAGVLAGEKNIEWRGTVNKWRKAECEGRLAIEPLSAGNCDDVVGMVERWRYMENGGMKYGWQERAGCDKALVKRYASNFEGIQDYVQGLVFKLDGIVVGYSCIEKVALSYVDGLPEVKYLTRKVVNAKGTRNLTEYIDYKTIEHSYKSCKCPETLLVNWGASSGGVHWYKTHKFPVHSLETKWFASMKA